MSGIFNVLADFLKDAILIACFLGIVTRAGNILVRAVSGKESFL